MVRKAIIKLVQRYQKTLTAEKIPVTALVLYGSQARGDTHPDSDIDVCVVLPRAPKNRFAMGVRLGTLATAIHPLLEVVLCSAKEWRSDRISPLLHEVRKDGVVVAE